VLVLFDHGTPKGLARLLAGHTVHTAQSRGWDTLSNGELLNAAENAGFDLLLTTDRRIPLPAEPHGTSYRPGRLDGQHQVVCCSTTRRSDRGGCFIRHTWQLLGGRDSAGAETRSRVSDFVPSGENGSLDMVRFLPAVAAVTRRKLLMTLDWEVVSLNFASWNQLEGWLRAVDELKRAA
jgi:hypothetical protein